MTVLIISIVVCVVLFIVIAGIVFYNLIENDCSRFHFFWTLLSGLAFLILLFGSFCSVGANEVGIIYDDHKGVLEETIGEGFKTKSIFHHVKKIKTSNRTAQIQTTGQTNDGQYATFTLSLIYKIEPENAGKFFKQTNDVNLNDEQLGNLVKQSLQSSTIKYDIFELLSEGLEVARLDFEQTLSNVLMEKYYITLISTSFDDVDAGDNIEAILQQKAEAEQKIEIARKEAEANLITAENEVKMAEQQAKVEQTLADAAAYAVKVKGEADADAATAYVDRINAMISNIQTSAGLSYENAANLVLSIVFYDIWDGKLPEVLTSDNLTSMIGGLIKNTNQSSN